MNEIAIIKKASFLLRFRYLSHIHRQYPKAYCISVQRNHNFYYSVRLLHY
ncbi:hypothetical protein DRW42_05730 [Pedobacter miscanthi]|uniref:Uncharacterized protein n=1 Tax=Pedobacter miscanthi TaxID=2259170 RepID=A0A366L7T0_9SPHI|nr:hypothetical protein DRW42_05730 [Pedobacter miscanthi]